MAGLSGESRGRDGMLGREARTQYAALARLRWRMFVNGLHTIQGPRDLGGTGIAWLLYLVFGLGAWLAFFAGAYSIASSASWEYLPFVFWGISLFWLTFAVFVTSFQEQSDLGILSRFPVGFGAYFLLHVLSAVLEASTFLGVVGCLSAWIGITMARPDLSVWAGLSLAVFAGFNILLTRAVLAWLDRWLSQRKTREILSVVAMVLFVGLLVANSVWNSNHRQGPQRHQGEAAQLREVQAEYGPALRTVNGIQEWLPPGAGALTVQESARQELPAGLGALILLGLWGVVAGGVLAGRLQAQFRGQDLSWAAARSKSNERGGEWTLGSSRPLAAMVEKEVRTLMRTVPWLWALSMPLLLVLVVAGVSHYHPGGGMQSFPFVFPLCVAYALAGFTALFYNFLGAEGAGIQLLFLSPTPIRTVLLAKNLLHSVLYLVVGVAAGAIVCARLGVPPVAVLADTGAWLSFALPCNLAAGIIFSLSLPYRINPGRITRPAGSQANRIPALVIQLGVLGAGVLVFWLCWSLQERWLPVPIFLVLAAGAFFVWTRILHFTEENALQRRDALISTLMRVE